MATTVVVFSKDRPWQLSEYIRTFEKFAIGNYKIIILWKSEKWREQYLKLGESTRHFFVEQSDNFSQDLLDILHYIETDCILFGVDDVLWYNEFNLATGEWALNNAPCASYSLRLYNDIKYCHPAQQLNNIPRLWYHGNDIYLYNTEGSVDFRYPLEVSSSMYKLETIKDVYMSMLKQGLCPNNPNELEDYFQRFIYDPKWNMNACINRPVCSVVTINRVQETHKNPVYITDISLDVINNWIGEYQYDTDMYAGNKYNSIHIGDFFVKKINN